MKQDKSNINDVKANKLNAEFEPIIQECRYIFEKKMLDYGVSWRVLRPESVTDQILNKVRRLKNIEIKGVQKVDDDTKSELMGIVNYSVIGLILLENNWDESDNIETDRVLKLYDKKIKKAIELLSDKNHDYDDAWRAMRISSIIDFIHVKLLRIQSIEDNKGETSVSEGIESNLEDIINYAIFAIIRISENKK
ncbi:MAG: DUF1599 domain-containing protein [Lentimicrobiaceae bacterium]|nr:DUF1599 domain-containing protein [Lentimicrobiaceae bacterium]